MNTVIFVDWQTYVLTKMHSVEFIASLERLSCNLLSLCYFKGDYLNISQFAAEFQWLYEGSRKSNDYLGLQTLETPVVICAIVR